MHRTTIWRSARSTAPTWHLVNPIFSIVRTFGSVKMRELLLSKSDDMVPAIPYNKHGQNESLKTILSRRERRISIEISPNSKLNLENIDRLAPRFVAITWLGNTHLEVSTRQIPAVALAREFCDKGYPVLLHLAGRNVDKGRMMEILEYLRQVGVRNILALQGDWPHILEHDDTKCDFPYASDLVSFIKANFQDDFSVGVAGYPNGHPHCKTLEEDMEHLKKKVDSGADFIVTQATFCYDTLEQFAARCLENDIKVPILPGVLVIKSYKTLLTIARCCEFKVAEHVFAFVKENREKPEVVENYGLELAAQLVAKSWAHPGLLAGAHIFTMNDLGEVNKVLVKVSEQV